MATYAPVPVDTETPVDAVNALSLTVGQNYGAQYQGPGTLRIRESVSGTAPALTDSASSASPQDPMRFQPASGEGIWLWVTGVSERVADGAQVVIWDE